MRIIIKAIIFIGVLTASLIASADLSTNILVPKEESTFAKNYLQKLHDKDFTYVKSYLDESIKNQATDSQLEKISNYFPQGNLLTTELIGSQVNTVNGSTWQGNFTFEQHFESGWGVANVAMQRIDNNKLTVIGFNVYRTKASQKIINQFSLIGKTWLHYLILIGAIAVSIFILITLIAVMKTPIKKRKWLWIIFILGGVGAVSINWTTGEYTFNVLNYQLFGTGIFAASDYAPWVITTGFPLGAILFWFKRKSLIAR